MLAIVEIFSSVSHVPDFCKRGAITVCILSGKFVQRLRSNTGLNFNGQTQRQKVYQFAECK